MNKTNETLRKLLIARGRVSLLVYLVLLLSMLFLASCKTPTRKEIDATIWLNNAPLPAETCAARPELNQYGFYRRLDDGKLEFISFCNPGAKEWLAIHERDFKRMLDEYLPEPQPMPQEIPEVPW